MDDSKKKVKLTIKWILIVCLSAFLLSSFCFFIDMIYIPLGFIIGMIISIINLIILYEFSYYLTRPNSNYRFLSFLSYFIRLLLYGLGFFICIILEYYNVKIFFWGTCLASYLFSIGIITIIFRK